MIRQVNSVTHVIVTLVGNGNSGFSGDGGQSTAASLSDPRGIVVDAAGDLFIADYSNNRVREVNALTHVITTVVGTGIAGYSGDGSQATAASLNGPFGVTLDAAGDLFIGDLNNNRIREVNAVTHIITTVVGNGTASYSGDGSQATAASVNSPYGIALDAAGDLFIVDSYNQRVREVNAITQVITTVAGNGIEGYGGDGAPATAASLKFPTWIALDATGDLFIDDQYNNRIREVAAGPFITVNQATPQVSVTDA